MHHPMLTFALTFGQSNVMELSTQEVTAIAESRKIQFSQSWCLIIDPERMTG